jgi:N-acetylneuraminate lyase
MTGTDILVSDLLHAASDRMPTLTGAKFTAEDLVDFARCVDLQDGRFDMLFGRDEFLLSGLVLGAPGGVGASYNQAAPVYRRIMAAFATGDIGTARAEQAHARETVATIRRHGDGPAGKAVMAMIGLDCGPVRLPQSDLSPGERENLRNDLEEIGFFDFCCGTP